MRIEVSDEAMRQAWTERWRSGWPDTFEAAMESPLLSRLVLVHALHGESKRVVAAAARVAEGSTSQRDAKTLQSRSGAFVPLQNGGSPRYWWQDRD